MKRYFVILCALLALTSCVIDEGTEPNLHRAAQMMYNRVDDLIYDPIYNSQFIAHADALLLGKKEELDVVELYSFRNITPTVEQDRVIFALTDRNEQYIVVTGGKKLSDGAAWQLVYNDGTSAESELLYTYTGVAGSQRVFCCSGAERQNKFDLIVKFEFLTENLPHKLNYYVTGSGIVEQSDYRIEFEIREDTPLSYRNRFYYLPDSGIVYMQYTDLIKNTTRQEAFDLENYIHPL